MGLVYEQIEVTLRVPDSAVKDIPEHAAGVGLTTLGEQAILAKQVLAEEIDMARFENVVRGSEVVGNRDQMAPVKDAVCKLVRHVGETHARLLVQARGIREPKNNGILVGYKAQIIVSEEECFDRRRAHDCLARARGRCEAYRGQFAVLLIASAHRLQLVCQGRDCPGLEILKFDSHVYLTASSAAILNDCR